MTFPSVDFEDARLVVTLNTTLSSPTWNSVGFNGILFTLESAGTLGITGAGVTAATTMAGFDSARVTFSDTTVAIDWQGLSYVDGTQVVIDFDVVPVPEPAAYLLLLGGLLALGLLRRRAA